jgi:hypothetical protein
VIATPDLIFSLAKDLAPVRRLRPPVIRAVCWLAVAMVILGLLVFSQGLRPDFSERLRRSDFIVGMAGMLSTGILAAIAAFLLSLPDRSRVWLLLPAPALLTWLSSIGYQCLTDWVRFDPGGVRLGETVQCFATLVLTSLPLSLVMLVMIRYAAPLRPTAAILTGSLAVAAMAAAALSLFHELDATMMILIWNLGSTILLLGLGCLWGQRMLCWASLQPLPRLR